MVILKITKCNQVFYILFEVKFIALFGSTRFYADDGSDMGIYSYCLPLGELLLELSLTKSDRHVATMQYKTFGLQTVRFGLPSLNVLLS